ncbi:MAG: NAD(P)-dependent oxidoreductase [Rhodobacteraceae bacterium]|nr:NAD(P)-dependent oxidoreductase [Paracoccaceae bacterium]
MPDTVLVTGASGFLGQAMVAALVADGHRVVGTFRNGDPTAIDGVSWRRCDLASRAEVSALLAEERPTHLVALAWHMGPGNQQAVENYRWIGPSIDLLMDFAGNGGQRVVMCGSCREYVWGDDAPLCEESSPLAEAPPYGHAKAALWQVFGPLCQELGLSGAWARPFFLYGPAEPAHRLVPDVILSLLDGREAACSSGTQRRDYLHVGDVASAVLTLMNSDLQGAVNIGAGEAIALKDIVLEIGRQIGREDLIRLGARPDRPDDPPVIIADTRRLSDELGWKPEIPLEAGLRQTIDWWRARHDTARKEKAS